MAETARLEELLAEHNRLEEMRLPPRFVFKETTCGAGEEETDCLEIWNKGGDIQTFTILQFSFLEVSRAGILPTDGIRYLPIYYYVDRHLTNNTTGLLAELAARATFAPRGSKNMRDEVARLTAELEEELGPYTTVALKIYISLRYIDAEGREHKLSYNIRAGDGFFGPYKPSPAGFDVDRFMIYMNTSPPLWDLKGAAIKAGWDHLLTRDKFDGSPAP